MNRRRNTRLRAQGLMAIVLGWSGILVMALTQAPVAGLALMSAGGLLAFGFGLRLNRDRKRNNLP